MQLTVRIPTTGFALQFYLNLPEQLCTLISFVGWHLIIITHSLNALICVNRFTAIGWPTRYKNLCLQLAIYGGLRFIRSFLLASSVIVVDVYMLSNTWILICVSRDVRNELRGVICGKRERVISLRKKRIVRSDPSIPLT
uniref:G_PROTEIN_RECEP_F1_2 domain-containing protein n=1 Tax=Ascaris lumbricoides TaxID=6252 RepID=A0A0M3IAW7_ASCLU